MVTFADVKGYSNTYPIQYNVKPRQPVWGDRAIVTGAAGTIFEYDIQAPYGSEGRTVSNSAQTTRVMVGWGMIVRVALLCSTDMILTVLANLWDGTFTQIDTSPYNLTANAKIQIVTIPPIPAFSIRGQLQAASSNSTVTYHVSLSDY